MISEAGKHRRRVSLSRLEVKAVWSLYDSTGTIKNCIQRFRTELMIKRVHHFDIEWKVNQVKDVVFQIDGFQEVTSYFDGECFTVRGNERGGIFLGVKRVPFSSNEMEYGIANTYQLGKNGITNNNLNAGSRSPHKDR